MELVSDRCIMRWVTSCGIFIRLTGGEKPFLLGLGLGFLVVMVVVVVVVVVGVGGGGYVTLSIFTAVPLFDWLVRRYACQMERGRKEEEKDREGGLRCCSLEEWSR